MKKIAKKTIQEASLAELEAELARREKEELHLKVPEPSEQEVEDEEDEKAYETRVASEKAELEAKFEKNYKALQEKEAAIRAKIEKLQIQLTKEAEKYGLPVEEGGDVYRPESGQTIWCDDTLYTEEAIEYIRETLLQELNYGEGYFAADGEWYQPNWNSSNC